MDEPTNDLDAETLELLEELLVKFEGTVLVVSHDRAFLDNVVTSTIVFEAGGVREYVGGYDDWLRQRPIAASNGKTTNTSRASAMEQKEAVSSKPDSPAKRRLAFHEKRELESLPGVIEALEAEIAELHEAMAQPEYYKQLPSDIALIQAKLKDLEGQRTASYRRWEELEQWAG
jgi:ATP-binding cassette subfamily F protein uup